MARQTLVNVSPNDAAAIDLRRVLIRLEHKILSQDADPRLQRNQYERTKTAAVSLLSTII